MKTNVKKISKVFLYSIFFCYALEGIAEQIMGSVWPIISKEIHADISLIGTLSMVVYAGSCITSLWTSKIRAKIGTNYTIVLSMVFFAIAITLFIFATSFLWILAGSFLSGLGIGLFDVNSESYVLKAYDAKSDSLMRSFWGIGAFIGPAILTYSIAKYSSYKLGFGIILTLYLVSIFVLFLLKRNWEKQKLSLDREIVDQHSVTSDERNVSINILKLLKIKTLPRMLLCCLFVNSVSRTICLFISTILVEQNGVKEYVATGAAGIFCLANFVGRIAFGYLSKKINIKRILIINAFIEILILTTFYLNILNKNYVIIFIIVLGFCDSILIPFTNACVKEIFNTTNLSAILSLGTGVGLIGTMIVCAISTVIIKNYSIRNVELMYVILLIAFLIIFVSILGKSNKNIDKKFCNDNWGVN